MMRIQLIAGLGNPGEEYCRTRHNAGASFALALAAQKDSKPQHQARFHGLTCQVRLAQSPVRLLVPLTYMNQSGISVQSMLHYYRLPPASLLVVYDELDLPPGTVRLKFGGGTGGHNGLADVIEKLGGERDFWRLRLGVGRPAVHTSGQRPDVTGYLLRPAPLVEQTCIDAATNAALGQICGLVAGDWKKTMNLLHGRCFTGDLPPLET